MKVGYENEISNLYWYSLYQASRITSRGRAKQSTYELFKLNVGWEFLKALLLPVPSYHGMHNLSKLLTLELFA
jgi:hypothetical protein